MVAKTLDGMAAGGMYDLVGGGFHRYSVDERWLVPHFEKMLYDNAQLGRHLPARLARPRRRAVPPRRRGDGRLHAAGASLDGGGLASAQDADTDGVEGLTFTWAPGEGAPEELLEPFEDGRFVLRGELDEETRARLFEIRARRAAPLRDDKAIASWNGLALAALAECGRFLGRDDWIDAGTRLAEFLLGPLSTADGRLHRTWRDGLAKGTGYLDDYANVANGLYELHVATGELRWLEESHRLALLAVELFADDVDGGFFQTPRRRREAPHAAQGSRRPSRAERQLDARLRPAATRRGSTATTSSRSVRRRSLSAPRLRPRARTVGVRLVARRSRPAPRAAA